MTVKWHGPEVLARTRAGAMAGVTAGIAIVEEHAVHLILDTPKSGRVYRRRGIAHQASAPGEPPASDTGTLVNFRRIDLFPDRVAARLTFTSAHAWFLEHGTRHMEPRPWADRALRETADEVRGEIYDHVVKALQ